MRHTRTMVILAALLFSLSSAARAEEGKDERLFPNLHGEAQLTGQGIAGPNDSAKFQEYRELPQGGSADWLLLDFENEQNTYYFELKAKDAGQEDMRIDFVTGEYGKWDVKFRYDRIPHRFLTNVGTLYSGFGTGDLRISDQIQADLQATTAGNPRAMLRTLVNEEARVGDIELLRDRFNLSFTYKACDPVTFGVDLFYEDRNGTRPIGGGFGFSNAIIKAEPIDYGIPRAGIWAAYDLDWMHVKLSYEYEYFDNRTGSLQFDNPFRNTHSAGPLIGAGPVRRANGYTNSNQSGARFGEQDLYPDNWRHEVNLETGFDVGWETRIDAGFSYTWRRTDDELLAYTTNQNITAGLIYSPDAIAGNADDYVVPFDAYDKANLPQSGFDGAVDTQRYTLGLTNRAIQNLEVRAKWRGYAFDVDSDQIDFPGYARVDAVWEEEEIKNPRLGFWRQNGELEFAYDFPCHTKGTVGYAFEEWDRSFKREADVVWSHTALARLDCHAVEAVEGKLGYEHTWRNGDYDVANPFPAEEKDEPPNLPFLEKYDEGDRERDKGSVQLTFHPCDDITPTAGYTITDDNYDANFGLTDDTRQAVNLGVEALCGDRVQVNVYGSYEWSDADQASRQWSPLGTLANTGSNGIGDPYVTDTGEFSFSNWGASSFERTLTLNTEFIVTIIKDKLDWENLFTWAHARQHVGFDSPIGVVPPGTGVPQVAPFTQYDNQNFGGQVIDLAQNDLSDAEDWDWFTLRTDFRWKVRNNLTVVVGYLFEQFDHENMRYRNYQPVPQTATGGYAGFYGLAFDPEDYQAHTGFVTLVWNF